MVWSPIHLFELLCNFLSFFISNTDDSMAYVYEIENNGLSGNKKDCLMISTKKSYPACVRISATLAIYFAIGRSVRIFQEQERKKVINNRSVC